MLTAGTGTRTSDRYRHHAAVFDSDRSFLDTVGPFVHESIDAAEPVLLALSEKNMALLATEYDVSHELIVLDRVRYENPVRTIHEWLRIFQDLREAGVGGIRAVGDVPHPGVGADWHSWSRYEAIVNRAFGDLPLWGLCTYDARLTPEHVLDDVARTHPFLTVDGDHVVSPEFMQPEEFLSEVPLRPGLSDRRPPDHKLQDPTPDEARRHLDRLLADLPLRPRQTEDLHVAVSELVSNARHHGETPVTVGFWADPGRIEVTVTDPGAGPDDPFAGWIPPRDALASGGGRGLWLTYQLSPTLDVWTDAERGFTARVSIGA